MRLSDLVVFSVVALAGGAGLAPGAQAQEQALFDWRGPYVGAHAGGALGLVDVENPFGPSLFGDTVRTPGLLGGAQLGYNWQLGRTVLGIEADASLADMDGTNTCFAYSGFYNSSNCRAHIDALGTLAGRLGWALPFDDRTLLYAKAGLAWEHGRIEATANDSFGTPASTADRFRLGWTLGAGAERAVSPRWSLKAEYDFLSFSGADFTTPASGFQPTPIPAPTLVNAAAAATHIDEDIHQLKIGMNYRIGAGGPALQSELLSGLLPPGPTPSGSGTEIEAGVRYVYGWGQFHKDLAVTNLASLASRLTYDSDSINGGEMFARVDTRFDAVVKGIIGAGSGGGHMNDEDWGLPFLIFVPYSNTLSGVDERIRYAIIDVGYDWWRGPDHKVTPFLGYSYFRQTMEGLGCQQIANPNSDCATAIPKSVVGITEDDTWQALRLGLALDVALAQRLTLAAEAAYLPYVSFSGVDDHILRSLVSPEEGHGTGVQLEAMLSYAVSDAFSVGLGGRYWSMWTTSGTVDFGGTGIIIPMRYAAEQAHLLVQGSYRFDALPGPD